MIRDEIRKGSKRVLLALCTGAGKTHVMAWIAKSAVEKGHKVLALMHRRQLVQQMVDRFGECGIDTAMIMAGTEGDLECQCQVATMQTYNRRLDLDNLEFNRFYIDASVLLVDEAHHVLSKTYQKILKNYNGKIVIGVTATPTLSSGVGMGEYFDAIVQPIGVSELIEQKHLVPGIYYGPEAPRELYKVKMKMGDYEKKELNEVMIQADVIGNVVDTWLRIASDKRTMVFAVKVNHSKALTKEFMSHGVSAEHLDAHSSDETREETLNRFRLGETQVITNVGLYTEGSDLPMLECVVLARPTKSIGLYLQMIGRGARPFDGKDDFIVIDHGGCVQQLGFYEDDMVWSLDGKEKKHKKKVERKKEKTLITCDQCLNIFTGNICPRCGYRIKDYGKRIEAAEAELIKLNDRRPKPATMEEKSRFYGMLEYYRRTHTKKDGSRYADGWVAWKYKSKFGIWPKGLKETGPIEPDQAFLNFITYQNIRYAKSKAKDPDINKIMDDYTESRPVMHDRP